jgi:[ribosomal protein S5]-alanine N-acetyltransferase
MHKQPTLDCTRLTLRPYQLRDADDIQRLIGAREVAVTTAAVPHPYLDGMAEEFIAGRAEAFARGTSVSFAISVRATDTFIGGIDLRPEPEHQRAEIGYWVGLPFWGQGYASEAAQAVVDYGFVSLGLNRIHARHFGNNLASGRVMQKIGMRYEGTQRQHFQKWGELIDVVLYALLRDEWAAKR